MKKWIVAATISVSVAALALGGAALYLIYEYGSVKTFISEKIATKEQLAEIVKRKAEEVKKKAEDERIKLAAPLFCANVAEFAAGSVEERDDGRELTRVQEVVLEEIAKVNSSSEEPAPVEIVSYYGKVVSEVYASKENRFDAYKRVRAACEANPPREILKIKFERR